MKISYIFKAKDPISALTHFVSMIWAIIMTPFIFIKAARCDLPIPSLVSLMIFMLSMTFLYAASAAYHGFNLPGNGNCILKKIDHSMISILIAGTYTPICVMALNGRTGKYMLISIWMVAIISLIFKIIWVTCPRYLSSIIYIIMGWMCIVVIPEIKSSIHLFSFIMLFTGGILYSIGGVIYAFKFSFNEKFSSHDLFHIFVMIGSVCHFVCIYSII